MDRNHLAEIRHVVLPHRYTFARAEGKCIDALGEERYWPPQAGAPLTFDRMVDGERVMIGAARAVGAGSASKMKQVAIC